MPDAEVPAPKESQPNEQATAPTDISIEEYHQHADKYLDALVQKVEEMQETRQDIELDYSVRCTLLYPTKLLSYQAS